jgi:hypothetical protein
MLNGTPVGKWIRPDLCISPTSPATHYKNQKQIDVQGYSARNLDRWYANTQANSSVILPTKDFSDHLATQVAICIPAVCSQWRHKSRPRVKVDAHVIVAMLRAYPAIKCNLVHWIRATWGSEERRYGPTYFLFKITALLDAGLVEEVRKGLKVCAPLSLIAAGGDPHKGFEHWKTQFREQCLTQFQDSMPSRESASSAMKLITRTLSGKRNLWQITINGHTVTDCAFIAKETRGWLNAAFGPTPPFDAAKLRKLAKGLSAFRNSTEWLRFATLSSITVDELRVAAKRCGKARGQMGGVSMWLLLWILSVKPPSSRPCSTQIL